MTVSVYIIQAGDTSWFKIGMARNVKRRVALMQTGNPHPLSIYLSMDFDTRERAARVERLLLDKFRWNTARRTGLKSGGREWIRIPERKLSSQLNDVLSDREQRDYDMALLASASGMF